MSSYNFSQNIAISRTDSIGDVVLTLPLCEYLKRQFPSARIFFIGKEYTRAVIQACKSVDVFLDSQKLDVQTLKSLQISTIFHVFPEKKIAQMAKQAQIPVRIGTGHRWFHWFLCNRLVFFSRKNSELHETQLNFQLLRAIGIKFIPSLSEIASLNLLNVSFSSHVEQFFIKNTKFHWVIHPKSRGSAQEWDLKKYFELIVSLRDKINFYVTGTQQEGERIRKALPHFFESGAIDMTGKFSLAELMAFINQADGLVACSTGPLHLAAALGKKTVGLYAAVRPIHAGRWGAIGRNVILIEEDSVDNITVEEVRKAISKVLFCE
ncbi:MAG: glycosyltransferase family 9 protein [Cytophagales bacterium]|nr:glycosyltransferase family 9 protein [Cytophagales bacterium]MDW8383747.1 glycosyltransferase family 9 protein [Flammeovirgaceae bacterium]